jgi:hypothetical protein
MCNRCSEIEREIVRHRDYRSDASDPLAITLLEVLIAELQCEKDSLHAERKRLSPEKRRARETERRRDAQRALQDHQRAQDAVYKNLERLRAERLAREASAAKNDN